MAENDGMTGEQTVRLDKWLWAARFFKTRSLAADACGIGRIEANGMRAKPSRDVRVGDRLQITNDAGLFVVDVLLLSAMRGPAGVAQALYRETEEGRESRRKLAEERKQMQAMGDLPEGRPSKRDRRKIRDWKGGIHRF
jgi:ribosome-associated heat shock protein Hsp15